MLNPQQLAALDRHVHCAVVANAGSGKTAVLVDRFMQILLLEPIRLDQVVAITFTRAAAAEMRQRLHEKIRELLSSEEARAPYRDHLSNEALLARLQTLSVQIGSARISTFHSFCAGLVRQYADVVGRSADTADADARLRQELCAEAVDRAFRQMLSLDGIQDVEMQHILDIMPATSLQSLVSSLTLDSALRREVERILDEPVDEALTRRRAESDAQIHVAGIELAWRFAAFLRPWCNVPEIMNCHDDFLSLADRLAASDPSAQPDLVQHLATWFTSTRTVRKNQLSSASKTASLPDAYPSSFNALIAIATATWDEEVERQQLGIVRGLTRLAQQSASEFARLKRRRNVIDFDDMIDDAMQLLQHPEISASLRSSIAYIMIDEFQDTDPTQYRLLELLAPALTDQSGGGPNVYIVGDDKQSIYQFRNADVRLFRRARRAIASANNRRQSGDTGLRPMSMSYRMHQCLVDDINLLCRHAFGSVTAPADDDEKSYDVAYADLEAAMIRDTEPTSSSIRLITTPIEEMKTASEFEAIAQHIASILHPESDLVVFDKAVPRRSPRAGDIAVLVYSNAMKNLMADALRSRGIPSIVYGGRSFFSRPEIADIRAALRAALDPLDDLSTAIVMRSPLLRCNDEIITAAALLGRKSSLQDGLATLAHTPDAPHEAQAALAFLNSVRDELRVHPISEVITPMLQQCGWHLAVSQDARYEQMLANIDKLQTVCADYEQTQSSSLADVLNAISIPEEDLEAEGIVVSNEDAVHIMTIHGAKGLEFPIVALAGLQTSYSADQFIVSSQIGPSISTPAKRSDLQNPLTILSQPQACSHEANKYIALRREEAQYRRLLYVALTRAKSHLLLSVPTPETAAAATGLLGILTNAIDAVGKRHVWTVPSSSSSPVEMMPAPRTTASDSPVYDVIPAPAPILVTASHLHRRHQTMRASGSIRRITRGETSSSVYGSAVHSAFVEVLRNQCYEPSDTRSSRIIAALSQTELDRIEAERALNEVTAVFDSTLFNDHREKFSAAVVEGALIALHGDTLIEGVLDVRMEPRDGIVEVWDWKTNVVRSEEHLHQIAKQYETQMQTYAWLCQQSIPGCQQVTTRLVFTKAAVLGFPEIDVVQHWTAATITLPDVD